MLGFDSVLAARTAFFQTSTINELPTENMSHNMAGDLTQHGQRIRLRVADDRDRKHATSTATVTPLAPSLPLSGWTDRRFVDHEQPQSQAEAQVRITKLQKPHPASNSQILLLEESHKGLPHDWFSFTWAPVDSS
jgi:hypothetical protein